MSPVFTRRAVVKSGLTIAGVGAFSSALAACSAPGGGSDGGTDVAKVGALIPFTGLETHNGLSMKYGIEIARDEVNKAGGLAGSTVQLISKDEASDVDTGVQMAQGLISREHVDVLIGTLLSSVRAAVFEVAKRSDMLFMNPTYYEGGLCAPNYFSTGATPNQGIEPLAAWAVENLGKKVYFIGSDYVWGTGSIKAAAAAWENAGGQIVGSPEFVPFGTTDYSPHIRNIEQAKPDVVWPFVAGTDGITFLKQLTDAGVRSKVEIVANYIDELIVPALSPDIYTGIVNCSPYYMALENQANKDFLAEMRSQYGGDAIIGAFGMNMYNNLKMLAIAAEKLDSWDPKKVREHLVGTTFDGPAGVMTFEANNYHASNTAYIAEITKDATFKIIETKENVLPDAYCTV